MICMANLYVILTYTIVRCQARSGTNKMPYAHNCCAVLFPCQIFNFLLRTIYDCGIKSMTENSLI